MRGKFITFEGGEGCGKSTQIARLAAFLREKGLEVVVTREPGGTRLAELIRGLLKDEQRDPPTARSELLLFLAARAQLVERVIAPALAAGAWVLSDRFSDSTLAYQGYGRGLPIDELERMNGFACGGMKPDLTLLLDVEPEVSLARMRGRELSTGVGRDRIENAGSGFHERLRRGFAELAAREPERIAVIDANGTEEAVWEAVWKSLKRIR
jgi:dTMP kinase